MEPSDRWEEPRPPVEDDSRATARPPAIVVGSGVTGLGMVRSFGRAGIPSLLLAPPGDIAHRSRWARPLPGLTSDAARLPLADVLRVAQVESGVLIPGSDSAVREIAELPVELARRFPASVPPRSALEILIDKRAFAAFMREQGLPHPRTIPMNGEESLDGVEADFYTRAFLKPRDSQRFFAQFGVKGIHVRSRPEAERRAAELREAGHAVVLQEYVPGPPTHHVFLDGFVDRRGELAMLLARRRTRMHPCDFGNSTLCETVPASEVATAVEGLRRLLDAVRYRGIFSTEVKLDAGTGEYRFLEVNARAWWYVEFASRCGVNVCEAAYRDALCEPVAPPREVPRGVRLLYPEHDLAEFRRLHSLGSRGEGPSAWAWFRPWLGARQALLVSDDPWPAVWDLQTRLAQRLRRRAGGET